MINYLLLALVAFMVWRNEGHLSFAQVFLVLLIAFHWVPLIYIQQNYSDFPSVFSLAEITFGIERAISACLFIYLGSLLVQLLQQRRSSPLTMGAAPHSLRGWVSLNVIVGVLMTLNNSMAAYQALSVGYLDIYAGAASLAPVKTITLLPVYVFSMFYLFSNWIEDRAILSRASRNAVVGVLLALVLSFVLTGSRSTVIYLGVSILVLCSARLGLKLWRYIPHVLAVIVASTVIGVLREGSWADLNLGDMLIRPVIELTNTAVVFINADSMDNQFEISAMRYIAGLLYLLPVSLLAQFGILPPELLSHQYVMLVDPGWADAGGGFGFSVLAEIYLLGGSWSWLISLFLGMSLGWVDASLRAASAARTALAASMGFLFLFVVRGEIVELYRNVFVVGILFLFASVQAVRSSPRVGATNES